MTYTYIQPYLTSLNFLDMVEPTVENAAVVFSEAVFTTDDVFWYLKNKNRHVYTDLYKDLQSD